MKARLGGLFCLVRASCAFTSNNPALPRGTKKPAHAGFVAGLAVSIRPAAQFDRRLSQAALPARQALYD
jgi:hypothetical protein